MGLNHRINWDNVKILKSESHAHRRRIAKRVLINQTSPSLDVSNCRDGADFPAVPSVFAANK